MLGNLNEEDMLPKAVTIFTLKLNGYFDDFREKKKKR